MKKNYTGLILGVLGIACGLVAYLVIWTQFTDKTDILKGENATLQEEVDRLQDLADHKEQYLNDTATMKAENEEIIAQFPSEVRVEDEIMYADSTEKKFVTSISSVAMPGSNRVEVIPVITETVEADGTVDENVENAEAAPADGEVVENTSDVAQPTTPSIDLYQTPVTINFGAGYDVVKEIVKEVTSDNANKKSIDMLSLNFSEETGDLEGTMTYSMYSLTGTDKTYNGPVLSGVGTGTNNLFNTTERKAKIMAEKAKENNSAAPAAAQ